MAKRTFARKMIDVLNERVAGGSRPRRSDTLRHIPNMLTTKLKT